LAAKPKTPLLFVGSSVESLDYAYAVQQNLGLYDAFVTVWPQGVFNIAMFGLDSLLEAVRSHDFGVFIFAPDDLALIRGHRHRVARDNVLFELGLFMGRLGRERTFIIAPEDADLHLPSDLLGWVVARYPAGQKNLTAAVGPACSQIRMAMARHGPARETMILPSSAVVIEGKARELPQSVDLSRRTKALIPADPGIRRIRPSEEASKRRPGSPAAKSKPRKKNRKRRRPRSR
jgi:hypothetical protein